MAASLQNKENLWQKVLPWEANNFAKNANIQLFKGYLRYKTITSQKVSSEAQIKNFFIS